MAPTYYQCLNGVFNVKLLVGAFNQEEALVGAFSVIVQLRRLIVYSTSVCGAWNIELLVPVLCLLSSSGWFVGNV